MTCKSMLARFVSCGLVATLTCFAAMADAEQKDKKKDSPFTKTFLTAEDLPGMELREDNRDTHTEFNPDGVPPDDPDYKELGGTDYGLTVWEGKAKEKAKIDRMVEIHFVFPDAAAAQKYLRKRVAHLAENMPQVKDAPKVGEQTLLVGGLTKNPFLGSSDYHYIFLYRVDRTLIKLYAFQEGEDRKLQPLTVLPIAKKIADRVSGKGAPPAVK